MEINILRLNLTVDSSLHRSDSEKIRGYLGNLFWDNPYVHHHKADGSLIYKYPCVQYKIVEGSCVLIGFNEGLDIIKKVFHDLKEINLDGQWQEILSKSLESYTAPFYLTLEQKCYSFLNHWLALNEENYGRYKKIGSWNEKRKFLERILMGNIISMSKGIGYTVPAHIKADILKIKETSVLLKSTLMIGFKGTFSVNFEIPDYFGLGKSVSMGFGTVKRVS